MSDYLYKDSNCEISLSQMDKTWKREEYFIKSFCLSLKFESDINNYLFAHAMYYNKKKTIAVEYNLNVPVPKEIEESISRMRYTTNAVEQLYAYLWKDIKKKDYIKFK